MKQDDPTEFPCRLFGHGARRKRDHQKLEQARADLLERSGAEELVFLEPPEEFDRCIIGIAFQHGAEPAIAYDQTRVILAIRDSMYPDGIENEDEAWGEAEEFFSFNTIGLSVGPGPLFSSSCDEEKAPPETVPARTQRFHLPDPTQTGDREGTGRPHGEAGLQAVRSSDARLRVHLRSIPPDETATARLTPDIFCWWGRSVHGKR